MTEARVSDSGRARPRRSPPSPLDPDAKRLVRDTMASGFRYPIELVALEKVLRFPVLAHWSFTTTEGATFETLMEDLDVGLLGTAPPPAADTPPAADPHPEVVETGHIGLGAPLAARRPRAGLVPRAVRAVPDRRATGRPGGKLPLAHSADQLRRVVPDGREDLSLAAAFEIGRLLGALAALGRLGAAALPRRAVRRRPGARAALARRRLRAAPTCSQRARRPRPLVALQVLDALVKNPDDAIGPRRPVADPGRELARATATSTR